MGIQRSSPDQETKLISYQNFYESIQYPPKATNNIYHSRLSNNLSTSKQLYQKNVAFTESTEEINRYLAILQNIGHKVECNNLYLPVLCRVKNSDKFCSEYRKLELFYETYNINITNQIMARRNVRQKFSQTQIWYILYSSVNAIRMFEQFSMNSGNLRTDKILLNQKGHLKLVNMLSQPESMKSYDTDNNVGRPRKFYSPEELRAMREKIDKRINYNIAQTFSLGIIIIEIATYYNGDAFYDMNRMVMNEEILQKAENVLFSNYSRLLYNLVKTMLSGTYDRPLPSQIYSVFQPYQNRILNLEPFEFIPGKEQSMYVSNASLMSL